MGERLFETDQIDSRILTGEKLVYEFYDVDELHRISSAGGYIEFYLENNGCELQFISSNKKGEGTRMVSELVKIIGTQVDIEADIVEKTTLDQLVEIKLVMDKVLKNRKELVITSRSILDNLRIVGILERGGLTTDSVVARPVRREGDESGLKIHAYYYGHT